LVAGRTRVPRPATGKMALRIFMAFTGNPEKACGTRIVSDPTLVAFLQPGTKADVKPVRLP
jgi:hypothetical protein